MVTYLANTDRRRILPSPANLSKMPKKASSKHHSRSLPRVCRRKKLVMFLLRFLTTLTFLMWKW